MNDVFCISRVECRIAVRVRAAHRRVVHCHVGCGARSMKWNKTLVTVKRLHKQPATGSSVDLLIHEHEYMA